MYLKKNIMDNFFLNLFIIVICIICFNFNQIYGVCDKQTYLNCCCVIETDSDIFETPHTENTINELVPYWKDKLIFKYIKDKGIEKINVIYDYDLKGRLTCKHYMCRNQEYRYGYNYKNQIIYKQDLKNPNFYIVYEYNDKNQLIHAINCMNNSKTKYEYDLKGRLIKKIEFLPCEKNFLKQNIVNYKYNEKGQKIQKKSYYLLFQRNNFLLSFINKMHKRGLVLYTYEYDGEGLKIKKINHQNGNLFSYKYYSFDESF
ncbi:hypothetical protein [Candidatus Phytoplasma fraxini]|uniref:Uncharacterized protein n=1 Tax=Ash yellows phytoplasma TaxID=35780 RepID=A0ABZ2U895_ASHYP